MAGRKGKYYSHVQPRLETIRAWRRRGLTEAEVMKNLGVRHSAFNCYKHEHAELSEVLKDGLDDAVAKVENAHFKSAIGYDYEETKIVIEPTGQVDDNGVSINKRRIEKTTKQIPPNVIAQMHFLHNRASQDWKDNKNLSITGKDGKALAFNVTFTGSDDTDGEPEE